MNGAQIHRGPDGAGEYFSERVALGMRRLSIIDRDGGWQPLYNADKSLALIINGEIYNYVELRERLKSRGRRFQTETDGEVILHLYEENPADFIDHLRGMFAFALWDENRQRLILARDRMGEKPLYIYETEKQILFASEMKSVLSSRLVPFELDARAVNLYFHYQYVPEPLTPIKNVRKLDAARILTIDAKNWLKEEKTYWKMEDAPPLEGEPADVIREKLEEVSRLVVRSDVPIGAALSGGLDSSAVTAFAARQKSDIRAFSVGYKNRPESDERRDAEDLARRLKIPFHEVELDARQIVDFFPELNFWRDDPIADIAGFGYYAVMRLAREQNVPVLLQGQGGDELFWGYEQLRAAFSETSNKIRLRENPFSETLRQIFKFNAPPNFSPVELKNWARDFGGMRSNLRDVRRRLKNPERMIFYDLSNDFAQAANSVASFYDAEFIGRIETDDAYSVFNFSDKFGSVETALTALVCATYLRENGIAQGDRLGMASSVEMRLPLVDYQFVETIIGLRKTRSDAALAPKQWFKDAVRDVLPPAIPDRPKRGFAPPTGEWHDALFAAYGDSLRDGFLVESKILSGDGGRKLSAGDFPANVVCPLSFKALVLEQWCRQMKKLC